MPNKRWWLKGRSKNEIKMEDSVTRDLEWAEVSSQEWERMAEDRAGWRRLVEGEEQTK